MVILENSDSKSISAVNRQSLRHTVHSRIEQAIIRGEIKGGERLNEAELARLLDVSRGLVREVIRELESSGIVVSIPYRGAFVKEWTPRHVTELYTLRSILEQYVVELAVAQATDQDLEELSGLIQAMYAAAQDEDVMRLVEIDLQFHQRLCDVADHGLLSKVLKDLSGQTHMFIMATKAFYSPFPTLEEAAASHEPILEAIRARDAQAAREAIHKHIREVGERYVESLREEER